jgi:5-methylcytosine-specific restriction endonuclease McrA
MARLTTLKPRLSAAPARLATMQPGSWRTDKMTSTQRGYGYKWQKARAAYLEKHPFCAFCLRDLGISYEQDADVIGEQCVDRGLGLPRANVVDHMDPHRGDWAVFWDSSRWQSLCFNHHDSEKKRLEASQA